MAVIKIGVLGAGHFGRFHALKLAARGCLSGLHDADPPAPPPSQPKPAPRPCPKRR